MNMTQFIGSGSCRYNTGKIRLSYIPPEAQMQLAKYTGNNDLKFPVSAMAKLGEHFCLGTAKYPDTEIEDTPAKLPNWAKGQLFDEMLMNSILRHLYAFRNGENYDKDFGSHHLIAVAWGLSCLIHQFSNYEKYKQFDDRMWVGFNVSESSAKHLMGYLMKVSVSDNPDECVGLLVEALYYVLFYYEEITPGEPNFKIDTERLEKIKSTSYGIPNQA